MFKVHIAKIRNLERAILHFLALACTFMHFLILLCLLFSWLAEILEDGAYLASGEILAVAVVACGFQLLLKGWVAVDPTHQMAGCCSWIAFWEIKKS